MNENHSSAIDLRKFGPIGLLLIATALLAISTAPGTVVISDAAISPQSMPTVEVTVLDCASHPVQSAVIQAQSLTYGQWVYINTDSNGNAFLSVPPGTYRLQGGYSTYNFNQTIYVGPGGFTETVSLGGGCSSFSISTTFQYYHNGRFAR